MPFVKRTRARRPLRRRKSRARKKTKKLATVAYVKRALTSSKEDKMVQITDELFYNTVGFPSTWFKRHLMYEFCVPGVTDRGRIGDSINMAGIRVSFKLQVFGNFTATFNEVRPLTWYFFLVEPKNNWFAPTSMWFKSRDRGTANPYLDLNETNVQNGLNVINNDSMTIHGMKKITVQPGTDIQYKQVTGSWYIPLKNRKLKLQNNDPTSNAPNEIMKPIYLVTYPYWGDTGGGEGATYQGTWGCTYSIMQYYRD